MQADDQGDEDEQVLDETKTLDADGKLQVTIPTQMNEHANDVRYRIEARVTDAGNREIVGTGFVLATYGSFRVRISPEKWFVPPGTQAAFDVSASDYDNHPIATPVTVELIRFSWSDKKHDVIATASGQTDAQGNARVPLAIPKEGGSFEVRVKAKNAGSPASGFADLDVLGRRRLGFRRGRGTPRAVDPGSETLCYGGNCAHPDHYGRETRECAGERGGICRCHSCAWWKPMGRR